ncbi:RagB/SusD family nutrient uptake outer membrane protein [uncultured Polaribacter sp.]|uniref:RagB/SusD family nutrient uptake outer membrane protein n=1 Tax=uncultured Polaribacter sp. TaxID=174711 RepID=UPI0026213933|nr:RagB/SusD family nutrient uptake outer membrane protein [uncultured Polaribacter sp.]
MKTFKYILLLLISISIVGCSDLEEEPVGLLSPETYFTDKASVQIAVNGVYTFVHDRFFLAREAGMALMLRSDMVGISDQGTRQERIDHDNFTDLADNGNTRVAWPAMWEIVSSANLAISGAQFVELSDAEINPLVAEAYFLRAFAYYHIVRQFGSVPYITEPVTDVDAASNISKTSVDDIYAGIIADLKFAKTWLPATQASRSLASKAAASAYLSSVYLTRGLWKDAFDEAKDIIDKKGTYNLDLEPNYQNLWNYATINNSKEPIFNLDYIGNVGIGNPNTDYIGPLSGIRGNSAYAHGTGWAVMAPEIEVYNRWNGRDYRKAVSLDTTMVDNGVVKDFTQFNSVDGRNQNTPFIAKYNRMIGDDFGGSGRASEQNYLLMRYAEVLLIAAEAAVEIGDDASAVKYINEVRARARNAAGVGDTNYPPSAEPADHSGSVTVNDVLEERRLELSFEMKRWYDIVRRDLGPTVFSSTGLEGAKAQFNPADDYLIAIPADEVLRNPNLGN